MSEEVVQLTPEQKRERFQKRAKIALMIGAGLLFAPVAVAAIGGLIGLGVAALIAVIGINAAPVVSMKLANWRMSAIMQEAREHPIETMTAIYIDNMKTIQAADEKIRNLAARLLDFRGKAREFSEKYPARAEQYNQMITSMQKVLDRWKDKQKTAKVNAHLYYDKIDEAKAVYAMGKEAAGLQQLAGDAEKTVNQNILKQVAFDEVNHTFNMAVADLTTEVDTEPDFDLDQKHKAESLAYHSASVSTPSLSSNPSVHKEKEMEHEN